MDKNIGVRPLSVPEEDDSPRWKLFLLHEDYRELHFDGSEYSQGVKDGIRKAMVVLGHVEMEQFIRGRGAANPYNEDHKCPTCDGTGLRKKDGS